MLRRWELVYCLRLLVCSTNSTQLVKRKKKGDEILTDTGYIGRIQMDPNPWNSSAFQTQICCIIIAPTFICAAIYLTLKHVALALSPDLSRIHPRWYPRIFLPADLSCLIIQAIGGGVAAAAKRNQPELARNGNRTIIAGVVLQVIVLLAFGAMGTDYYLRVKKYLHSSEAAPESLRVWQDKKFRMFGFAVSGAYFAILTRCIYRSVQILLYPIFLHQLTREIIELPKWLVVGVTISCRMSLASSSLIVLLFSSLVSY
jgi:hypothetical protein